MENRREGKTQKEELQGIVIVVIAVEEQNIQVLHTTYIYMYMYVFLYCFKCSVCLKGDLLRYRLLKGRWFKGG